LHREPANLVARQHFVDGFARIRGAIAAELLGAQASGELKARSEFATVMKSVIGGQRAEVGTTNWDTVLERALRAGGFPDRVVHLHGTCDRKSGEHLYLPTEVADEPYRTKFELANFAVPRATLVATLQQAQRLVLYGLALSPLDAELGQVLASGMNESTIEEVLIVNPDYPSVAERVAGLTDLKPGGGIPVIGSHPLNLGHRWTYDRRDLETEKERLRARMP
jgi:hypothetical protein